MYFGTVWIHLLAATYWVGGMLFLSLVIVPLIKAQTEPGSSRQLFLLIARRFRKGVWGALALLVLTGWLLLPRHVSFAHSLVDWPPALLGKLVMVALFLAISLLHEGLLAPTVRRITQRAQLSWTAGERLLVKGSPWVARLGVLIGLSIYLLAVVVVRQ